MKAAGKVAVWAVVLALYVHGGFLSSLNPYVGMMVFAISLWPILVAEVSRSDASPAVLTCMGLPLWIIGAIFLFNGALGDPMPGLLPEDEASMDTAFIASTAFFPGGLLAAFALKRMDVNDDRARRLSWELLAIAPWIPVYLLRIALQFF